MVFRISAQSISILSMFFFPIVCAIWCWLSCPFTVFCPLYSQSFLIQLFLNAMKQGIQHLKLGHLKDPTRECLLASYHGVTQELWLQWLACLPWSRVMTTKASFFFFFLNWPGLSGKPSLKWVPENVLGSKSGWCDIGYIINWVSIGLLKYGANIKYSILLKVLKRFLHIFTRLGAYMLLSELRDRSTLLQSQWCSN